MTKNEIIRMIYDLEREILDEYDIETKGDLTMQYGEMCGVHMMASLLIDKAMNECKDGGSND